MMASDSGKKPPIDEGTLPEITIDMPKGGRPRAVTVPFARGTEPTPYRGAPPKPAKTLVGGGFNDATGQPPSRPGAPHHAPEAALAGVAAASLAASAAERNAAPAPEPPPKRNRRTGVIVDVLWSAPNAPERARAHAAFGDLAKPESVGAWITDGKASREKRNDPRDVARALTQCPPHPPERIAQSLAEAVDDEGIFTRPALVVDGTLTLRFDPAKLLAAILAAARPFANKDKRLASVIRVGHGSDANRCPSVVGDLGRAHRPRARRV